MSMYSMKSFRLTEEEYNYLLPVYNVVQSGEYRCVVADDIEDLTDILNSLKGAYTNWYEIPVMVVYNCSISRSIEPFREYMSKRNK